MSILVVGGTSGVGLELAKQFAKDDAEVTVTGIEDPAHGVIEFRQFDIGSAVLFHKIGEFVAKLPTVQTTIYAEHFYEPGDITELRPSDIQHIDRVNRGGLVYLMKALLSKQEHLDGLMVVNRSLTSEQEESDILYSTAIAGTKAFSDRLFEKNKIDKLLVTNYLNGHPQAIAERIMGDWVRNPRIPLGVASEPIARVREAEAR